MLSAPSTAMFHTSNLSRVFVHDLLVLTELKGEIVISLHLVVQVII